MTDNDTESNATSATSPPSDRAGGKLNQPDDEISLLDLAIVLAKYKKVLLAFPIIVAILVSVYVMSLPAIYTASTRLLPPQQGSSSASALLSQLGGLAGGLVGGAAGIRNLNDVYIGMLKSRSVADSLIARFNLDKIYGPALRSDLRAALEGRVAVKAEKDGMLLIEVDDKDPKFAAELANAYVDELIKLTSVLAVTEASQRRLFYERQLAQAKENLTAAEIAARQALDKGGISKVDERGRGMVELTGRLRGQISVKEVQIEAMRAFAADRNPELLKVQEELQALKRELSRIEGTSPSSTDSFNSNVSVGEKNNGLDSLGRLRDIRYHETIYEFLAKQYELAKLDEAEDSSLIQVLDKAIEPDRKSKPKRTLIVMVAAFVAFLLAILWALVSDAIVRGKSDSETAEKYEILRRGLLG
jgi:tyrosine-protein kinase Etk/Wzc